MATIKDIARKLNISTSTVSYALNGGPRPVPDEVRDRVLKTAKELQYRPNRLARSLITGRSFTIGVVPTQPYRNLPFTPYFQGCFNGIVNEAESLGQDILLFTRYDQNEADAMADTLLDGRVDGLVFVAPVQGTPIFDHVREKIPFVIIGGEHEGAPAFMAENRSGARRAVEHLVAEGHRRIAHITGGLVMDDAIERRDGYLKAMTDCGLSVPAGYVVEGNFTRESGYAAAACLFELSPRPTAVFCGNDEMALGLMRACADHGVRVPEDLSVVGFDDAPLSAVLTPPLTTVVQPWIDMGSAATRALLSLIAGDQHVIDRKFETQLIVRASTSCPKEDL
jgi:DNA-binding LacI/PurR family transcriptional regulator